MMNVPIGYMWYMKYMRKGAYFKILILIVVP